MLIIFQRISVNLSTALTRKIKSDLIGRVFPDNRATVVEQPLLYAVSTSQQWYPALHNSVRFRVQRAQHNLPPARGHRWPRHLVDVTPIIRYTPADQGPMPRTDVNAVITCSSSSFRNPDKLKEPSINVSAIERQYDNLLALRPASRRASSGNVRNADGCIRGHNALTRCITAIALARDTFCSRMICTRVAKLCALIHSGGVPNSSCKRGKQRILIGQY